MIFNVDTTLYLDAKSTLLMKDGSRKTISELSGSKSSIKPLLIYYEHGRKSEERVPPHSKAIPIDDSIDVSVKDFPVNAGKRTGKISDTVTTRVNSGNSTMSVATSFKIPSNFVEGYVTFDSDYTHHILRKGNVINKENFTLPPGTPDLILTDVLLGTYRSDENIHLKYEDVDIESIVTDTNYFFEVNFTGGDKYAVSEHIGKNLFICAIVSEKFLLVLKEI